MRRFSVDTLVFAMRYIVYRKELQCNAFCDIFALLVERLTAAPSLPKLRRCRDAPGNRPAHY